MTEAKKGGGVLGFLSKVGVIDLHEEEAPVRDTPLPAAPRNTPLPQAPASFLSASQQGAPDPAVLERLEKRLQTNCPPAYASFMEQYEALGGIIHDEATRFTAALKTSHTTADQIIGALDQLLSAMDTAKAEFLHNYDENKTRKLGEGEASIRATEEQIASYEKQAQSIQETIASLRTKRETDTQAMHDRAQEIEGVKLKFDASLAQVVGRLQAHKSRVLSMPKV